MPQSSDQFHPPLHTLPVIEKLINWFKLTFGSQVDNRQLAAFIQQVTYDCLVRGLSIDELGNEMRGAN